MQKTPKMKLADRLHRGFVWTCIGISALAFIDIAYNGYNYIMYLRPVRKLEEAKIEQNLLMEGRGLPSPAGEKITT